MRPTTRREILQRIVWATDHPKPPRRNHMKTRLLGALVGLAISFALPTFAQQKETVDPQLIQKLYDTISKKGNEAYNNHDAAAIGALYTEDAVHVNPDGFVYGRKAIENWLADVFKSWQPKNH